VHDEAASQRSGEVAEDQEILLGVIFDILNILGYLKSKLQDQNNILCPSLTFYFKPI